MRALFQNQRYLIGISIFFWAMTVFFGFFALLNYSNTPGQTKVFSKSWPEESQIPKPTDLPVLIVALHPQCPCSRASVTELEKLMTHLGGRVQSYALFAQPAGLSKEKVYSDLWKRAQKIPGVKTILDEDAKETQLFGARISGETFLYNPAGHLVFHGGITSSRGHEGENPGSQALLDFSLKNKMKFDQTAVFGCPLLNVKTRKDLT